MFQGGKQNGDRGDERGYRPFDCPESDVKQAEEQPVDHHGHRRGGDDKRAGNPIPISVSCSDLPPNLDSPTNPKRFNSSSSVLTAPSLQAAAALRSPINATSTINAVLLRLTRTSLPCQSLRVPEQLVIHPHALDH